MMVNLAAQVLSETVGNVLNNFGPEETAGTGTFCLMMNKFFIMKGEPFLKPYESTGDVRFVWLDELSNYLKL